MSDPYKLSRRVLLGHAMVAAPLAVTPVSAAVALSHLEGGSDADIISLGEELRALNAEREAFEPIADAAEAERRRLWKLHADRLREAQRNGTWSEEAEKISGHVEKDIVRSCDLQDGCDKLVTSIVKARPVTLDGLLVQAEAMVHVFDLNMTAADRDDLDWDQACVAELIESIRDFAARSTARVAS